MPPKLLFATIVCVTMKSTGLDVGCREFAAAHEGS
jgi:hypothetical protein